MTFVISHLTKARENVTRLTLIIIAYLFFFVPSAFASNFSTDYHAIYTIGDDGVTHAKLNGTLTNTTSQYYASSYKVRLGFDQITNVVTSDGEGLVTTDVSKTDQGYTLTLTFNKKAVGAGAKLPFTISFDTPSIARKQGKIWEINIPGIANPNDFTSFVVEVQTPSSFGKPTYVKPPSPSNSLVFTKEQLGRAGISIAFGDSQQYAFHLTYHLKNDNLFPVNTSIALPMTTNYQNVFLTTISPRPVNVIRDKDGNWLAQYSLLPSQKKDIVVLGKAQINLSPQPQPLSKEEISLYTSDKPYWQATNSDIKALAKDLKNPQAIYDYVVKTLKYDFSRVTDNKPRLGSVDTLKNQDSAVCREFTDLFIALSRSAGIPAREVDGFAYTENTKQRPLSLVRDILHSWPEYYDIDKKTWVMVDPTWGSTTGGIDYFSTLDFDHFAFVIKGQDSSYPIPAGGYKVVDDINFKDVDVSFTDSLPEKTTKVGIETTIPRSIVAGLPISGKLTLINNSAILLDTQAISLTSSFFTPHDQTLSVEPIPPFGKTTIPLGFYSTPFLTNSTGQFTIRFRDKTAHQTVKIIPVFLTKWGIGGLIFGILAIFLLIITIKIRRLRIS